jgi:hypothetical protein
MVAPLKPALVRSYGAESWGFVPAVANKTAPTLIELQATAGFNLSCSVFGEQDGVTSTTEKVTLPRRLCETDTFEVSGATTHSMADLMISFDPQAATNATGRKAWDTMADRMNGFLWHRQGIDSNADLATAQRVNIIPIQLGTKVPGKTGTGSDGVFSFTVSASVTDTPAYNVAIV